MGMKAGGRASIDGMAVVDATKKIELHIGQLDIPKAKSKNPATCVAAQACMRNLGAELVRVHLSRVFIKMPGKKVWVRYTTPASLRSEIIAFDRGGRFSPGEYTLNPVCASDRRDHHKKKQNERLIRVGKGKKRVVHHTKDVRINGHTEYGA